MVSSSDSLCLLVRFPLSRGGDEGVRTPDPLRARQVLSQLSYTPIDKGSIFHLFESLLRTLVLSKPSKLNNAEVLVSFLCFAFGRHFGFVCFGFMSLNNFLSFSCSP